MHSPVGGPVGAITITARERPRMGRSESMSKQPTRAELPAARLVVMDDDVRRRRADVARGSQANADNYWRMLALFLEREGLTPKGLIELNEKQLGEASSAEPQ